MIVIGLVPLACTDLSDYDHDRVSDALSDSLLSVTESRHIEMNIIDDEVKTVTLFAPIAITYTKDRETETHLKDSVLVLVRDSLGTVHTRVSSMEARYIGNRSEFHFHDEVVVESDDQRTLYTDYLKWSHQSRSIETPDFVIVVTESDSITGYGLQGSDDLLEYTLFEVTGEFSLEQNPKD
ncbi:LPS export ABC transporter periplasmic protein LptC [Balneolaceae bacterium ANBcel3]|nr:LPS export ABC transporter periplasmic protein LptC [Balneolaceae bacterium ANBcel3]